MTRSQEMEHYRRGMAALTPENPRREADIQASLGAFDAGRPRQRRLRPAWLRLRLPVLLSATALAAAALLALAWLPQQAPVPQAVVPGAPDLRLALPAEPPARAEGRDAQILAAFGSGVPQYFPLPWQRGAVLALLPAGEAGAGGTRLFAAGDRQLVVLPRAPESAGQRGQEEGYQRFAIALAGLALIAAGQDPGPAWPEAELLAAARSAARGVPAREAALAALLAK